ncbi:MAG: hypothetical protein AUJ56_08450 [Zetaproteobacteria bacterium CG1_02_49_23]|nr:MAG: hypothetical protein AUJ56_08450 [Zetaproteobacteria bacterium CG1_02_49_23]
MSVTRKLFSFAILGLTVATLGACGGAYKMPVGGIPTASMMMSSKTIELGAENRENYAHILENSVKLVAQEPVSTFSADVDTASYSNVRRMLNDARLPPHDAVRIEEMINYFSYDYPAPQSLDPPFHISTEMAPSPWNNNNVLLQIGLQGAKVDRNKMPAANLVFLVDVSGSMHSADKLGLLKYALKELTGQLTARDRVTLVVYAGASGVVLAATPGNQRERIDAALESLSAGGSTNGGEGIRLAYAMAKASYIPGGINRIMLATDGDFNVGTTNFEALLNLVEEKRKTGISLSVLGFGEGNIDDQLMEQLADHGNGSYAYIDTPSEARKVLVEQVGSTLLTIAKDVKIQIEFNSAVVSEYRLIGYGNRLFNREDLTTTRLMQVRWAQAIR